MSRQPLFHNYAVALYSLREEVYMLSRQFYAEDSVAKKKLGLLNKGMLATWPDLKAWTNSDNREYPVWTQTKAASLIAAVTRGAANVWVPLITPQQTV